MSVTMTTCSESSFFRISDFNLNKIECITRLEKLGHLISFQCHNVTIMKNAQGDRVIIQEVKCHNVTIMKNAQGDRVIIQEVK